MAMQREPLETAEAHSTPTVRQHSVFLENRVGQLLALTRAFDETDVRILAVSIVHSVDCAICRLILDDPDRGHEVFAASHFKVSESELLVVGLRHGKRALFNVWAALLRGEVNIHYTYPLITHPRDWPALALCVDDVDQAVRILREQKFELFDEADLRATRYE